MSLFFVGIGVLLVGGLLSAAAGRNGPWSGRLGALGAVVGCGLALAPAVGVLGTGVALESRLPWPMPGGSFRVEIDALSAFFLLPILALSALAAVYGTGYLRPAPRPPGAHWLYYNALVAGMALTVAARNGILFLIAWETMTLASFFLVTYDHQKESVREAGWIYMVATHLGTAFLLALFLLLQKSSGSLDFDRLEPGTHAGLLFVLAVLGFGTKAGFLPLHVWLPEAHPAAPSHVSALMSGVMIKTGIYGLVRILTLLGPPPLWWGWLLVGIGATSGILGVLFALAQHDLKRLLAYHSVENIGIIALGLGLGVLGVASGSHTLAVLGFAGGLLHVANHAAFKGLLFLGAGAVLHATGAREIDHLGGLQKKMPWTAGCFLVGAAAISGLPPLNGFVSEFLIYLGAFRAVSGLGTGVAVPAIAVIGSLALIGGLAAACFSKAYGMVFLGEARSGHAEHAHDPGGAMVAPMLVLAAACAAIGLAGPWVVRAIGPAIAALAGPGDLPETGLLGRVSLGAGAFLALAALLAFLRSRLLAGRRVGAAATWGCGYAAPSPRMQYTASSYAQPLTDLLRLFLRTRKHLRQPGGYFPGPSSLETETPDVCRDRIFEPVFRGFGWVLARLNWLQVGQVHLYVLYIALTLLALLIWRLH
ncbi:MAG: hypothetical protein HYY18_16615 [Planctomycetes bacterium]|nr:hypothetical protein [Planctomycetota bacterium]